MAAVATVATVAITGVAVAVAVAAEVATVAITGVAVAVAAAVALTLTRTRVNASVLLVDDHWNADLSFGAAIFPLHRDLARVVLVHRPA